MGPRATGIADGGDGGPAGAVKSKRHDRRGLVDEPNEGWTTVNVTEDDLSQQIFSLFCDSYIEVMGEPPVPITADQGLEDLAITSLDFIEIAMRIEDQFDIELDATAFEGVTAVGAAVDRFVAILEAKPSGDVG